MFCSVAPSAAAHSFAVSIFIIQTYRQHAPTIIALLPAANMTMATEFDDSFWIDQLPKGGLSVKKKKYPMFRIFNEKMVRELVPVYDTLILILTPSPFIYDADINE
jgi:hypothetical protein